MRISGSLCSSTTWIVYLIAAPAAPAPALEVVEGEGLGGSISIASTVPLSTSGLTTGPRARAAAARGNRDRNDVAGNNNTAGATVVTSSVSQQQQGEREQGQVQHQEKQPIADKESSEIINRAIKTSLTSSSTESTPRTTSSISSHSHSQPKTQSQSQSQSLQASASSSSSYSPSTRVLYISSTIDILEHSSPPASNSSTSNSLPSLTGLTAKNTLPTEVPSPPSLSSGSQESSSAPPAASTTTFMDIQSLHPVVKSFLVGSVSGTCSTVLFQPLDLVKTRLQQRPVSIEASTAGGAVRYQYNGMITVVGHIVRDEKLSGLWRGMTPALSRCVPGVGLYFASIHALKMTTGITGREPTALESVCLGITGRALSGVALIPFTVVKTRFESQHYQYKSLRSALTTIYTQEGYRGLTSGLIATLARDAPFSGIYLMLYTSIKKLVPAEYWNAATATSSPGAGTGQPVTASAATPYLRFSCGILAGLGASVLTQPADVIKTKMQLYPNKFQGLNSTVVFVYKKYGVGGYFKGLVPRMVRRTLVAAMSWTIYEQLMNSIGLK